MQVERGLSVWNGRALDFLGEGVFVAGYIYRYCVYFSGSKLWYTYSDDLKGVQNTILMT